MRIDKLHDLDGHVAGLQARRGVEVEIVGQFRGGDGHVLLRLLFLELQIQKVGFGSVGIALTPLAALGEVAGQAHDLLEVGLRLPEDGQAAFGPQKVEVGRGHVE